MLDVFFFLFSSAVVLMMLLYSCSTKFSPMEKLEVLKTTFEKINEVGFVCRNFV